MKSFTASFYNAIILIVFGLWGYFSYDDASYTALIPVVAGVILLVLNRCIIRGNKLLTHVAVAVTLLMLFGLVKPLLGSIDREDSLAIARVSVMMLSTLLALTLFIREYVEKMSKK